LQNFVVSKKLAVVFSSKVCYTTFREVLYSLSARSPGWRFYNVSLFAFIARQEISATFKQHICDMQFNVVAVALKS